MDLYLDKILRAKKRSLNYVRGYLLAKTVFRMVISRKSEYVNKLAGGARVCDTGNSEISSKGCYFRTTSNRSSSWSGILNLHTFLTTNTIKGPFGVSNPFSTMNCKKNKSSIYLFV